MTPASATRRWAGRAARVGAAVLGAHAAPALTSVPPLRRRLPRLRPDLCGRGGAGHVALTFDDGPSPASTPPVLDGLARLRVRATFFVLGERAAAHPDLLRAIADAGHEIAVHGWRHDIALGRPLHRVHRDLARARDTITAATGRTPTWFRPAYGVLTTDALVAARALGLRPVLWSAWGRDWTDDATARSVAAAATHAATGLRGGDTLLLHDADHADITRVRRATADALPAVVAHCRALGLAPGPLSGHGLGVAHLNGRRPSS